MALSAYIGLPGSGKSYGVVKHVIIPALTQGRQVWTNIPINIDQLINDNLSDSLPHTFEIEDIQNNLNWFDEVLPKGVLLVLDECQLLWPSGLKQTTANAKHIQFLTKHRHFVGEDKKATEIILLTQRLSLTANFVRGLVEKTFVMNNLAVVGTPKSYRIDIHSGAVGDRPNIANVIRNTFGTYEPKFYKYYQSHTESDYGAGDETRIDDRISIFGGWKIKAIGISMIFVCFALYYLTSNFINNFTPDIPVEDEKIVIKSKTVVNKNKVSLVDANARLKEVKLLEQQRSLNDASKEDHFFKDLSDFYISLNNGVFPNIDYFIKVNFKGASTTLNINELTLLGYNLTKINACLVILNFKEIYSVPVMCRSSSERYKPNNIISDTVTASNS
jgi:zona occludens toxin (predicted ATPase)